MAAMFRRMLCIARGKALAAAAPLIFLGALSAAADGNTLSNAAPAQIVKPAHVDVAKAYLQAVQARDFSAAYRYISSSDRRVRDENTYLANQPSLAGFALRLARWFAAEMQFSTVEERFEGNRVRLELGYRLPSGDEVADRLFNWNSERLNALGAAEQGAMIESLERTKQSGKMIIVEGRETVELVREKQGWKVFEGWQSRQRVLFRASRAKLAKLGVHFARADILVKVDEPFQVDFKVVNQSDRATWVRVKHAFAPRAIEKNIDEIACGSLVPFRLEPGEVREISSVYLFGRRIVGGGPVAITYEFAPVAGTAASR